MSAQPTDTQPARPRIRDAEATKGRILDAAKKEFARNGLEGARVDAIALEANANKRMIYHYFESKEKLFQTVLENAYFDIRESEKKLDLDSLDPRDALERLVRFTWNYYIQNPEFISLVNSENLAQARHLKTSEPVKIVSRRFVGLVDKILKRGVTQGLFRDGVDPVQLNITIAAVSYYYFTNQYTGSIIFERELMSETAQAERIRFNIETILRIVSI
ncbi:transcriptional regulator TetR [Gluconobacter thailandicus F149-1 = NBRC 100600]|uniref:TetR family transcriptional regulator n=1 Tax=Gluconobacter thailandicus NBRC 3257 TaxID=1381097 RepID=A0ABQ0IUC9_GLUTH|nr:TetR/AcrR family transcriptional regulator [Gluconobacter thailandicus]AFW00271.1 TetR/AcrR family transcriptional regulator [Gluconobacter oxydans H24]ANQ40960.1 TetR family transcriptional regulator [Gluconobacter oxydans]KXV53199.1 TetR family transcriptional regulator [Gluconobacter thailandicus]GAC88019.1 TetR family transcriptional regulator [Gluconobacter thailandicus NBRC 3255]GAD25814.1 TetR family transcriptional regulator [Gluconobacter thailandicus NBRC 3257]